MDTDYDNFAVAYACRNLADGKSEEEIRIGSRTAQLNPDVRERVDKLIDAYFDRSMIRAIEHDEAKYVTWHCTILLWRNLFDSFFIQQVQRSKRDADGRWQPKSWARLIFIDY